MALKNIPWWARITAKIVLSRLPISYDFWRKIGLFRHGEMNHPEKAIQTFEKYFERAQSYGLMSTNFSSLEIGPGDSILSALVASAFGAKRVWLVDAGRFADTDVSGCLKVARLLEKKNKTLPDLSSVNNLNNVLERVSATYLTEGTDSLKDIPSNSIDFFWSQVVFEHIPLSEFTRFLRELRRIVSDNAIGIHSIDFRDHLGGSLNNLRVSEKFWESKLFSSSGFYTNRIRPNEMLLYFKDAGFDVEVIGESRWTEIPTKRKYFAQQFQEMPDEDFLVAEIEVILRPNKDFKEQTAYV